MSKALPQTVPQPIFLIDGIGAFFRGYGKTRINWSKIPWRRIQKLTGEDRKRYFDQVRLDFRTFCSRVAAVGYNSVSLDDLPHLALHRHYSPEITGQILQNRSDFLPLFSIAKEFGLKVYLTTDVMVFTPCLEERLGTNEGGIHSFYRELLDQFFQDFPLVDGVIIRIGESDGLDVKDAFRSRLVLREPSMVNRFLKAILPVFEQHGRTCIFRTWTVGAHRVGDLIWREATLERTTRGIRSPALVLSMKYGESDFFRFLSLNRNFFVTDIPAIVELQTRREYEGCGEFPSFIGSFYGQFALELRSHPHFRGISVWCQTGGWTPFRRLTYLDDSAVWTEINTFVTLRIFRDGQGWEEAVAKFPGCANPTAWIELLRLSEEVVSELMYIPEFASRKLYFRRVRIPPLLGVYWNKIFISHSIKRMLKHFVEDGEAVIRSGQAAMDKIRLMRALVHRCGLHAGDIEFMEDTMGILALAREYFFRPFNGEMERRLRDAKEAYKNKYPRSLRHRYQIRIDLAPSVLKARHFSWFVKYLLRTTPNYRFIDQIIGLRLLSYFYPLLKRTRPKMIPKFARKSAMGIDAVFK